MYYIFQIHYFKYFVFSFPIIGLKSRVDTVSQDTGQPGQRLQDATSLFVCLDFIGA